MLTSRVRNIEFLNAESLDYSPITNYNGQGLCERMWFMPNINEYFQEYNDEMKMKENIIKELIDINDEMVVVDEFDNEETTKLLHFLCVI